MAVQIRYQTLLYTGSMPRSVFMQIMHENHEFACAKINAIDFVCINCCWNEVRVNSNNYSEPYVQNRCFTALLDNKFICMALNSYILLIYSAVTIQNPMRKIASLMLYFCLCGYFAI